MDGVGHLSSESPVAWCRRFGHVGPRKTFGVPVRKVSLPSLVRTGPRYDAVIASVPQPNDFPADNDSTVVVRVFALSDVGHTREHNEDTFLVANLETGMPVAFDGVPHRVAPASHGLLFLVADGMGGAASGELASSMAGDVVLDVLRESWIDATGPSADGFAEALRNATEAANTRIHQYSRENPEHRGMGTTATIAGLFRDRLFFAQVGDSRAYLVRDGQARQLTKDQSLMQRLVEAGELTQEEADVSDRRNIILQALGPEAHVTVDLTHQQVRRGDTLILCSDGLSGLVRTSEIGQYAREESDVRALCQRLVDKANERGGPDNITVIAARFDGDALEPSTDVDEVGYATFLMREAVNPDTTAGRVPQAQFRSDPTPRYGTPILSKAAFNAEFSHARAAEDHAALGAPDDVVDKRRRSVQPLMWCLALLALVAVVWLVSRLQT